MRLRSFEMESEAEVRAPVERVWAVFSGVRRWPEWSRVCLGVSGELDRLWAPGAEFGFQLRMAGAGVPFHVRVTESYPPRRVAWSSTRLTVTAKRTFTFSPSQDGTVVRDRKEFSSPALPIGLWYPRRAIRTMTERWLAELRAEAERGA
jgi:hypothetical protein